MNSRDSRDDHLFLWCAFLVFVFVLLPALYVVYADDVNRPLLALAEPCFAGSCQDMQDAVGGAIQERNGRVSDTHDVLMPDPETERDALSGCLGSVNAIGDVFSLGVTLPSMDQIVAGMCSQVNSYINRKINEAHTQVNNSVNGMGGNNPFKVYGTGGEYVVRITGKLK